MSIIVAFALLMTSAVVKKLIYGICKKSADEFLNRLREADQVNNKGKEENDAVEGSNYHSYAVLSETERNYWNSVMWEER